MPEAIVFGAAVIAGAMAFGAHKIGVALMYLAFTLSRMGVRVENPSK